MAKVRPSSMYSKSEDAAEDEDAEGEKEESSTVDFVLTIVSLFLILITFPFSIWKCVKVAQEYERVVILRLGRLQKSGVKGPGIFLVIPCLDELLVVDLRTGVHTVPPQDLLTSDSVAVSVDAVLFCRVEDPLQAVIGNEDYLAATKFKAQAAVRSCLGGRTLQGILRDREEVALQLRSMLQESVYDHGVRVERLEVRQVGLPEDMQRSLASEAEAGVQARAKMILSQGEEEASRRLVDAGKGSSAVSMHLSYLQAVSKVATEQAFVCPFPFDIIKAFLKNRSKQDDVKAKAIRRRKRTKKTI